MATVANNDLVDGLSGRLGASLVFRTMRGKTFVTTPARRPDKRKESTAQRGTRASFKQAAEWAQIILLDPEKKAYYRQRAKALKLPNAYTAALTDYMRKPKVIKTQHRDRITYVVSKPGFKVKEVRIDETKVSPFNIVIMQQSEKWLVQYKSYANVEQPLKLIITNHNGMMTSFKLE